MNSKHESSPPRPRLVVQIGVIGHRPNRLAAGMTGFLADQCHRILSAILDIAAAAQDPLIHAPGPPLIRIVSPLAEGSDRLVAEAGLALGAELQCPLPFPAAEYERDFEDAASRAEFFSLLARASAVLELEGLRNAADAAYERVGRTVIYQSDIVIAIWDGEDAAGRGGTAQMVEEARALKLPVIWLHACREMEPCLLLTDGLGNRTEEAFADLPSLVALRHVLSHGTQEASFNLSRAYYAEKQPWFDGGRFFRIFRDFVATGRWRWGSWRVANFESSARAAWQAAIAQIHDFPEGTRHYLLDKLCPHYAWADGLSTYYAGKFRSCSVAINLLSACAVLFALVGPVSIYQHHDIDSVAASIELCMIAAILLLTFYGRQRRWHERWLNYRQLAELLRQLSFLGPLACPLPSPQLPAHFGADPHRPWVDGMFRMIARDLGLAPGKTNRRFRAALGAWVNNILTEQIRYHHDNATIMRKLNHHLHRVGTGLFIATLLACLTHLALGESVWLLLGATVFPAFGAAFYAISNQGEYARIADRSQAMSRELEAVQNNELSAALSTGDESLAELRKVAERVAACMIAETVDWNFVFRFRSLDLPG
ncbi:MAG: DUF4231 domain-containing protein [Terracidiphilus sp.]|jgi:hypothetical protein